MTLPLRTSLAAAMMSSGRVWLSVPISSFGPHLPQFLYFSAASRRSWRVTFLGVMEIPFLRGLEELGSGELAALWEKAAGRAVYCATRNSDDSSNERIKGGCHGGGFACSRVRRRTVLAPGRHRQVLSANLSHTAGPTGRALWGRRSDRRDRAHRRTEIVGDLGAAGLHRKHPRRGGNTGVAMVARAPADGYPILVVSTAFMVNPSMYAKVPYDPTKDFSPITLVAASPNVVSVNPSFPAKSLKELVDLVKDHPGKYSFAQPSTGSTPHLAGELF